MNRFLSFKRLSLLFGAVFAVATAATLAFQHVWVDPGERCEKAGKWYDIEKRICAKPVYIPDITHRPEGVSRAEASAAANRELVELERQAAARKHAADATIEAERRAYTR